ncbi:MAG: putative type polysaccharide/polyol phosphate export system that might be involved in cell [Polaromonas sp.]|nr:putative type polysaccharide/polyol phosphate export system that might be involved in cell [Polaromonas sp.]
MATLQFHKVTVQYPIYSHKSKSLRSQLLRISTGGLIEREAAGAQVVTALQDISFEFQDGDRVGLLGHNGAGKSTLLRTMAGVYAPVTGTVKRTGRVATVLELGAGMDGDLSGYENIQRMCRMLGRTAEEAERAVPDIEEFSQLGGFLNLPVRTYSSGMTTRLMFAVATSTVPDILLLDEVFSAGDAEFQVQARQRMAKLISGVGIFVFASHDYDILKQYCNRFLRLEHGCLSEIGASDF